MKKYHRKKNNPVTKGYCVGCQLQWTCEVSEQRVHYCPDHTEKSSSGKTSQTELQRAMGRG